MSAGFNLLRYPVLARQQRWRDRTWGFLGGVLGSTVLSWLCFQWLIMDTDNLGHELQAMKAQLARQQAQAQVAQSQAAQQQSRKGHAHLLVQLQTQQQALTQLHAVLQSDISRSGLTVQRLQIEPDKVILHAQAPDARTISQAGQNLSQRLAIPLSVGSLSEVSGGSEQTPNRAPVVAVVWQGPWGGAQAVAGSGMTVKDKSP